MAWFVFLNNTALAQNWCSAAERPAQAGTGGFTLRSKSGCAPFTAEITAIPTTISNDKYIYHYQGGDPFSDSLTRRQTDDRKFVFERPGKYRILQLASGGGAATGTVFCDEIDVFESRPVAFTVTTCADRRVTLSFTNDAVAAAYDEIRIDWGDGTTTTIPRGNLSLVNKTYANSASQTITVQGIYRTGSCQGQARTKTVTPGSTAAKPVVRQLTDDGTTLTLDVQAGAGQSLTLLRKEAAGNFTATTQTRTGPGTFTVPGVSAHPACFKVATQDACGITIESDEVCSIGLEVTAGDKQNELRWTSLGRLPGFVNYQIHGNTTILSTITDASQLTFVDNQGIQCSLMYCYWIVARVGQTEIKSAARCVMGQAGDVPPGFVRAQVSVTPPGEVALQAFQGAPPVSAFTMVVSRSESPSGPFTPVAEVQNNNTYVDGQANTQSRSYCYQVRMKNACGATSAPTSPVCTVHLDPDSAPNLEWTPGSPFLGEVVQEYRLEKLDENGRVQSEVTLTPGSPYDPALTDPSAQRVWYRVKAVSGQGTVSYSNLRLYQFSVRLYVPDAFTPNNDGLNDRFEIKGSLLPENLRLTIYNRWGVPLFTTGNSREGWDGTVNGQPAPAGLYTYRIDLDGPDGRQMLKAGTLLLIR